MLSGSRAPFASVVRCSHRIAHLAYGADTGTLGIAFLDSCYGKDSPA